MNKEVNEVSLTSSRLQQRSERRQSPSSRRLLSKTWAPSSKVDTRMPAEKDTQHCHYLTLQKQSCTAPHRSVCFLEPVIALLRREWQHKKTAQYQPGY